MSEDNLRSPVIRVVDCYLARATDSGFEFLLLLRAPGKIYAGDWRMVGGKIRPHEKAWEAALREVNEETGLSVEAFFTVPYVNRFYEWHHDRINDIPVFVGLVQGSNPTLDAEHTDFAWLSVEGAVERLPWPGQRDGLLAAHQLLTASEHIKTLWQVDFHESAGKPGRGTFGDSSFM